MYDEMPSCPRCGDDNNTDGVICRACANRQFDIAITDGDALKVADLHSERMEMLFGRNDDDASEQLEHRAYLMQ